MGAHLTAANCFDEAGVTNIVWQLSDEFVGKWTHTYGIFPPIPQGQITARYVKDRTTADDRVALAIESSDIYKATGDAMKPKPRSSASTSVDRQSHRQRQEPLSAGHFRGWVALNAPTRVNDQG